ncbi:MAG TPA: carboxypeptidase-like regulatory domain-containing protein [Gemmataceae bacterium]|nr:carboxypeptidase-like regulatory domain-containing protein [Gemmataceae bacterium]
MSSLARLTTRRPSTSKTILSLDRLEDRDVPSATALDLTHRGAEATANGAVFRQADATPPADPINTFVRLQDALLSGTEQGYNTDARPTQFDARGDLDVTHAIRVDELPLVTINGVQYREVVLDIKQWWWASRLSLDELRLYVSDSPDLHNYNTRTNTLGGLHPVYDMDAGHNAWVKLDANLNRGFNKAGDMVLDIPADLLGGGVYFYLYSKFGVNIGADGGAEQWCVRPGEPPALQPATISGTVFFDVDNDGVLNPAVGDAPLEGWTVFVDANGNGVLDPGETSTTTDAAGHYSLGVLTDGTTDFTVMAIAQETVPPFGGPPVIPSPTSINPAPVLDVQPGENRVVDFGFGPPNE